MKVIGRIPARDDDSSYSGSLRFSTIDHHIDIDDNGTITVARPLSELLPSGKEEVRYIGRDGLTSTVSIVDSSSIHGYGIR